MNYRNVVSRIAMVGLVMVAVCFASVGPAWGADVTFNFNSLSSLQDNVAIKAYMDGILASYGATVAVSSGASTSRSYDGDDHVVGPCSIAVSGTGSCTGTVTPLTLGTSEGAGVNGATTAGASTVTGANLDTFIRNKNADFFSMEFTGLTIVEVSFDWQIFPDATCQELTSGSCGGSQVGGHYPNEPDFKFKVDNTLDGAPEVQVFQFWGVTPGTAGSTYKESMITDGGSGSFELTPQLIGTGTWTFSGPMNKLSFVDWPATIGIDNLKIKTPPPPPPTSVPEPVSFVLVGIGLASLAMFRRKMQS